MAVDITIRSVLTGHGEPRPQADWRDGAVAEGARADKERKYAELARGNRCALVVVAIEAGGRFSGETCEFLRDLADAKASASPAYLRRAVALGYEKRFGRVLAISAAKTLARSIVCSKLELACAPADGDHQPWLQDVLTERRFDIAADSATSAL